jgi:uncharacterized protein Yka (UPF0111/DUF47 family)
MYLEDQTDSMVQSITALVDAIRKDNATPTAGQHMSTIITSIENMVNSVDRTANEPSSYQSILRQRTGPILSILQDCKQQMVQASMQSAANVESLQQLPPLAFKIARETKQLVSTIMTIETVPGGGTGTVEDDFS